MNAPPPIFTSITERSTDNWRAWWITQSRIDGTDWVSIGATAAAVIARLHIAEVSS